MTMAKAESLISQSHKKAFRNPWVLGLIGMLLVVLAINIAMIVTAFVTSPGLVSKNYYANEIALQKHIIDRMRAREALGWKVTLRMPHPIVTALPGEVWFAVNDRQGKPVSGAKVVLHAYRPSNAGDDFEVPLHESSPGKYSTNMSFPLKGIWDLIVTVDHGKDSYEVARRVAALAP